MSKKSLNAVVAQILEDAKSLALRFRVLTGKPLGITGEVAEFAAADLLGLKLAPPRQPGYDATKEVGHETVKYQIKGRCIPNGAKPGQRLGKIRLDHEWDAVLLVILDEDLNTQSIHEADRAAVTEALLKPGSKARNERGALAVAQFKSISRQVWPL